MESLISDVVGEIVAYLSLADVTRLASTSKHFQNNIWPTVKNTTVCLENAQLTLLSRTLTNISNISFVYRTLSPNVNASFLHPLTNLTSLRSLISEMISIHLHHDMLNIFTTLTQLERIRWTCRINEADVPKIFAHHSNLTNLAWLMDPAISYDWSPLIQLKKLHVSGINLPYYKTKCNIGVLTNLTSLYIRGSLLNTEEIDSLTNLTNLRDLRADDLAGRNIIGCFTNIVSIDIRNSTDINIDSISNKLTKLKFTVQDEGTVTPKSSLLTNIKYLVIESNHFALHQPFEFQFTDLQQLNKITLKYNGSIIEKLAAAKLTNLQEISILNTQSIGSNPLTKEEILALCQITTLKKLSMHSFTLDYRTFLQNVKNLSNLQSLMISTSEDADKIKPEFVRFLQPLTRLTYLQLPTLSPATVKKIAVLTQLIELNLHTISESQVDLVKQFPFRVTYEYATSNL